MVGIPSAPPYIWSRTCCWTPNMKAGRNKTCFPDSTCQFFFELLFSSFKKKIYNHLDIVVVVEAN